MPPTQRRTALLILSIKIPKKSRWYLILCWLLFHQETIQLLHRCSCWRLHVQPAFRVWIKNMVPYMQSGCDPNEVWSASSEEAREPRTHNDCVRGGGEKHWSASHESLHKWLFDATIQNENSHQRIPLFRYVMTDWYGLIDRFSWTELKTGVLHERPTAPISY